MKPTYDMHEDEKRRARLKGISCEKDHSTSTSADAAVEPEQRQENSELLSCKASLQDVQEKYVRLSADLENFKRRTIKEQQLWREMAQADLLIPLIAIVDNFDRAMEHRDQQIPEELKSWAEGIAMIHRSLQELLASAGVKEVSYETFDPAYHEALMQVESDKHQSGQIVTVMEKGYSLHDRVLRPAKVSVAK